MLGWVEATAVLSEQMDTFVSSCITHATLQETTGSYPAVLEDAEMTSVLDVISWWNTLCGGQFCLWSGIFSEKYMIMINDHKSTAFCLMHSLQLAFF